MKTKEEVLKNCKVEGLTIKLPPIQLERTLYKEVAAALQLIGGSWKGGKKQCFEFLVDPTDLLEKIAGGESINLKKEYQFFATPAKIADYLVELAEIDENAGQWILEPSAGQGALIHAINRKFPDLEVDYFELMDVNRTFLEKIPTARHLGNDFLSVEGITLFDRIIANPPFTNNQDIDHVYKMWELLNVGGRIVCITSTSWETGSQKKHVIFKTWLKIVHAEVIPLPKGSFKESGTMVGANILVINKIKA